MRDPNPATYLPPRLLAKSVVTEVVADSALLQGHSEDVFRSATVIAEVTGARQLEAFGLSVDEWLPRLASTLKLAASIHDWGKANNHFQIAVRPNEFRRHDQPIRHEWISVWIANQPSIKEWLLPSVGNCEKSWHVAMSAVGGHHPKVNRSLPTESFFGASAIEVYGKHDDFEACMRKCANWFNLNSELPNIETTVYSGAGDRASKEGFVDLIEDLCLFMRSHMSKEWLHFCAVVKAALVAADVAGSALWEYLDEPLEREQWIKTSLVRNATKQDFASIVASRLEGEPPRLFQERIENSTASVTLVEAGCGTGKTAAAYMWAKRQLEDKRLWFCYPTTGTATEGYRGYLMDAISKESQTRAELFHSRAEFDVQMMRNDGSEDWEDETLRIESLKAWDTQIVACTVDTVLCLLQNQRRGLYAWPALANSAIVFDEVHCYDDVLFGNLLTWLRELPGIPVVLMTASLPSGRRSAIQKTVEDAHRTLCHIPQGPDNLEQLSRYRNHSNGEIASRSDALKLADVESTCGRVLWISNTVARTRKVAEHTTANPFVYHSRFIYKDRRARHEDVVDAFKQNDKPAFASTSQVAEMSLDLAYVTFLITELASIAALIQRLGRLNRRADWRITPPILQAFVVIEPLDDEGELSPLPYTLDELELARAWLQRLGTGPLSQRDLIEHWHALDNSTEISPEASAWIKGGMQTVVNPIRESGRGITVIWEPHQALARSEGVIGYTLPMDRPKKESWRAKDSLLRGYPVASETAIEYDEFRGARWASCLVF